MVGPSNVSRRAENRAAAGGGGALEEAGPRQACKLKSCYYISVASRCSTTIGRRFSVQRGSPQLHSFVGGPGALISLVLAALYMSPGHALLFCGYNPTGGGERGIGRGGPIHPSHAIAALPTLVLLLDIPYRCSLRFCESSNIFPLNTCLLLFCCKVVSIIVVSAVFSKSATIQPSCRLSDRCHARGQVKIL